MRVPVATFGEACASRAGSAGTAAAVLPPRRLPEALRIRGENKLTGFNVFADREPRKIAVVDPL